MPKFPPLALALVASAAALHAHAADDGTLTNEQRRGSWFAPSLLTNADPICGNVLEGILNRFYDADSTDALDERRWQPPEIAGATLLREEDLAVQALSPAEVDADNVVSVTNEGRFVEVDGQRLFLTWRTYNGCGGACERVTVIGSPTPRASQQRDSNYAKETEFMTPRAWVYQIYRSQAQSVFAATLEDNRFVFLQLRPGGGWTKACEVALTPQTRVSSLGPEAQAASNEVSALRSALVPAMGVESPDCGQLRSHERFTQALGDASWRLLYQPWALSGAQESAAADGDIELPSLQSWSSAGVYERDAYLRIHAQVLRTIPAVADFYVSTNHWPRTTSVRLAQKVTIAAIGKGVRMPHYQPYVAVGEGRLRAAILDGEPLETIQSYTSDIKSLNATEEERDNILSVAVRRPEVLRYLIEKGVDPDRGNAFGKTPLMYAAQYNQLESAQLLLDRGADPNATTRLPDDTCFYQVRTRDMTPLHYAARYASRQLIELLVAKGAAPYFATGPVVREFPSDWLKRYTGDGLGERNPNISAADVDALAPVLRVPSGAELSEIATKLALRAEAQYAAGEVMPAYRTLRHAVQADPGNTRALAAMSLVALKAGKTGESLEASTRLLDGPPPESARSSYPTVAQRADAQFNVGLACHQASEWIFFNGETYCQQGAIKPMLRAWSARRSPAVEKKVDEVLRSPASRPCVLPGPRGTQLRLVFVRESSDAGPQVQRIYAQHPYTLGVKAAQISWTLGEQTVQPKQKAGYNFTDYSITVFEADKDVTYPVRIGTQTCEQPR